MQATRNKLVTYELLLLFLIFQHLMAPLSCQINFSEVKYNDAEIKDT